MNTIGQNIYEGLELLPEDLQGWNSNSDIFSNLIKKVLPNTIIEVGTWKGGSAVSMAKYCKTIIPFYKSNYDTTKIYCIDTWLGAAEFWTGELARTPERNLLLKNG